jgi:dihydrofolate synthase/folylpolyglutamate synthase
MKQETDYIYSIPKFAGKSTPDNTLELLRRIGFREEDRKIIHVAGTNGKGSVCSYIANTLLADNRTVGLFVSPHLLRINERMRINGKEVSDEVFEKSFAKVKAISEDMAEAGYTHPSFFEFLFGMAMDIFTRENVEYIVLETGLGGRLDATNVITNPIVTIITSIGLDHTDILGDTYESIAMEKAGIIKPGVPVIYDGSNEEVNAVIRNVAREKNSEAIPLMPCDISNVTVNDKNIDFCLNNKYYDNELFCVKSRGLYQVCNAALAALAMKVTDMADTATIKAGISSTVWTARMQEICPNVIVDGAHNDDGVTRFIESVERDNCKEGRILLFSAVSDKHYEGMIDKLCKSGLFEYIVTGCMEDARALDKKTMMQVYSKYPNQATEFYDDVRTAYNRAKSLASDNKKLYIAGSLYLAGEILAITEGERI